MKTWNNHKSTRVFALIAFFFTTDAISPAQLHADPGGSCHFHGRKEASEDTILRCSIHHRNRLAKKGTIESRWTTLNHDSMEKVVGAKGKQEWRLVYSNPEATDASKKQLFLFFSLNGNFIAANHSGK